MKKLILSAIFLASLVSILVLSNKSRLEVDDVQGVAQLDAEAERYVRYMDQKKKKKALTNNPRTDKPDLFGELMAQRRIPLDKSESGYEPGYRLSEYNKMEKSGGVSRASDGVAFASRGPSNISGRTSTILIDPRDSIGNTWIAGAAGGGIWKTEDGGTNWTNISSNMPIIAIPSLAWSSANFEVIYAGTGEPLRSALGIDGAGVFKTEDGGVSWNSVVDTELYSDFVNVSRIVVHPDDENIVWAAAVSSKEVLGAANSSAIYKSTDGGGAWTRTLSVDGRLIDLNMSPFDSDRLMATWSNKGVYISSDGGASWTFSDEGISGKGAARIEVSPSEIDSNLWWALAETEDGCLILKSEDNGINWQEHVADPINGIDFCTYLFGPGNQGWYDNVITPHPFERNVVYLGGVNTFKATISDEVKDTSQSFFLEENNTESFLDGFPLGANPGDFISYGNVSPEELPRIELRFGDGGQKAHRFTVGGRGRGVPESEYVYENYTDVPFQAWDVENDRQLMISYRDQAENGVYNLIPRNTSGDPLTHSREYLYIHLIEYSATADSTIARLGGVSHEQAYFIWPLSAADEEIDLDAVPSSNLLMDHEENIVFGADIEVVSDGYDWINSVNSQSNAEFAAGLGNHVDQHFIYPQVTNRDSQEFRLIFGNDGGIYLSESEQDPGVRDGSISYVGRGYITTQFYGADKAPGVDRYIGGMQDNSTWFTGDSTDGSGIHDFEFAIGGDGFEAIWNNVRPNVIWGGSQNNGFDISLDGGQSWRDAVSGLNDNSPFYTKIATSKNMPEQVYALGASGIWIADYYLQDDDFWELTVPEGNWTYNGSATDIEVSKVDPKVVIAGGLLSETNALHVSIDGGKTFVETGNYDVVTLGSISGIESHPTNVETIYALFSFVDRPKILRSTDLGMTWEDISGFENGSGSSDRGFPDVAVNTLFVFPNDTSRIWAGTDIGIIESLDNGETWNILDCELGVAPVWEMKLQDDQIVISTHGRGIWTATIEGYEPDLVLYPDVYRVDVDPFGGEDDVIINAQQHYDSLFVVLNSEVALRIGSGAIDANFYRVGLGAFGEYPGLDNTIELVGYVDGEAYISLPHDFVDIAVPDTVITRYFNDFADITAASMDFVGNGLGIATADGFSGNGIQSAHPYLDNDEFIYQLAYPVAVEDQVLSYEDVAIIEPGEDGTVFGDDRFWDFVVIEGVVKGTNEWVPLFNGYDAGNNETWLDAYSSGSAGTEEMLAYHSVPLTEMFESGDTILVRFRLSADANTNGWGWFVDYLSIESITTSTEELESAELSIYPNPVSNLLTIDAVDDAEISELTIMDISGKVLLNRNYSNAQRREQIDVQSYPSGVYLVRVKTADAREVVKKIIVQ